MIIDKLENSHLYNRISERINKAFEYIHKTDLKNIKPGRYKIEEENIFALISEYKTKSEQEGKLEAHRKYLDVQYVIYGEELVGYIPLGDQEILQQYREENDIVFFKGEKSFTRISEGMFAIFFPDDLHMPGIISGESSDVKKLVIKVRVN